MAGVWLTVWVEEQWDSDQKLNEQWSSVLIIIKEIATPVALSYKFPRPVYFFVVHAPPRRVGQGRGLPPKPRSVKITKTCGGAQRGKVDFNPFFALPRGVLPMRCPELKNVKYFTWTKIF